MINSQFMYEQIIAVRDEKDDVSRGYIFEQLIREILPWTDRPPIALNGKHEQLDAAFVWDKQHFLVEAKAKRKAITAGSHDWEDFELKLRKRSGAVYGLFLSLNEISEDIFQEAEKLIESGIFAIIVSGEDWDDLFKYKVPFSRFINYALISLKFKRKTRICIQDIVSWYSDKKQSNDTLNDTFAPLSSHFLRRFKSPLHEKIYVDRSIDERVIEQCRQLRPTKLGQQLKVHTHQDISYKGQKALPSQILLIRDFSGAGKTTLATQLAVNKDETYVSMVRVASQGKLDDLEEVLSKLGEKKGLDHFIQTNKVLLYVVDSLDEAVHLREVRESVIALIESLSDLNKWAKQDGLIGFPILLVFTIREDYWRDWESVFEGQNAKVYVKRFSNFQSSEIKGAIKKYSLAYRYQVIGNPPQDFYDVLSNPFNLMIFSETYEHEGKIEISDVFSGNVLGKYFEAKKDSVSKRPIDNFNQTIAINILSELALLVAEKNINRLNYSDFVDVLRRYHQIYPETYDRIILFLTSERVIQKETYNKEEFYRFRHNKFIEYLVAYYTAAKLAKEGNPRSLEDMSNLCKDNKILSVLSLNDNVSLICQTYFKSVYEKLTDYYAKSNQNIANLVKKNRISISCGGRTSPLEIDAFKKGMNFITEENAWSAFLICAAKTNRQDSKVIDQLFCIAWDRNSCRDDRWKLVEKVVTTGDLFSEDVLKRILKSKYSQDWLVWIDGAIAKDKIFEMSEVWSEMNCKEIIQSNLEADLTEDWERVKWVGEYVANGQPYPLGES